MLPIAGIARENGNMSVNEYGPYFGVMKCFQSDMMVVQLCEYFKTPLDFAL